MVKQSYGLGRGFHLLLIISLTLVLLSHESRDFNYMNSFQIAQNNKYNRHVLGAIKFPEESPTLEGQTAEDLKKQEHIDDDLFDVVPYPTGSKATRAQKRLQADMFELSLFPNSFMEYFDPDHMVKFVIEGKSEEVFYFRTTEADHEIIGSFYVRTDDPKVDPALDIAVYDSNDIVVKSWRRKCLGEFGINATKAEDYKIVFSNKKARAPKTVTFLVHNTEDKERENSRISDEILKELKQTGAFDGKEQAHLGGVKKALLLLLKRVREISGGMEIQTESLKRLNQSLNSAFTYNWNMLLLECAAFMGMVAVHTFVIKKALERRLIA